MKIPVVLAELFLADEQTEGRTHLKKLIVAFRSSANAPVTSIYAGYMSWQSSTFFRDKLSGIY